MSGPGYDNKPVGVLLLTPLRSPDNMELTYMGLIPEVRGLGLSKVLLHEALRCARECQNRCLTLAVDCRNHPAYHIYSRFGFSVLLRSSVMYRSSRFS